LAEASDIVTDYLSAFGMEAEDATYLSDLLSYAQSNSNTTVEQLSEAYKNCAANMNAAGQSVETTTSLLAMMANQGYKGSEAGTALTAVMRDITNGMDQVTDVILDENEKLKGTEDYIQNLNDMYGQYTITIGDTAIAISDADGNYRQLTDILADVETATANMTDTEQAAALQTAFTADSIKGLNLLMAAGSDSAIAFADELANSAGTASDAAATMQDNITGDLASLSSAFEGLQLNVFDELEKPIRNVLQTLTKTLQDSKTKSAATELGKVLADMANTLASKLPSAISAVSKVVKFLWDNKGIVAGIAATLAAIKTVTTVVSTISTILPVIEALCSPAGGIALGVAATSAVVAAIVVKTTEWSRHLKDVREDAATISDETQNAIDATNEYAETWANTKKEIAESGLQVESSHDNITNLKESLLALLNADGTIKTGYEEQVNNILQELNEYGDTAWAVSDNTVTANGEIVGSYKEISDAIDECIEKQYALNYLELLEEESKSALEERPELLANAEKIEEDYAATEAALNQAENLKRRIEQLYSGAIYTLEDKNGEVQTLISKSLVPDDVYNQWTEACAAIDGYNDKLSTLTGECEENRLALQENAKVTDTYKAALADFNNGDYDAAIEKYRTMNSTLLTSADATAGELQTQLGAAQTYYDTLVRMAEESPGSVTEEEIQDAKERLTLATLEAGKNIEDGVKVKADDVSNAVKDGVLNGQISLADGIREMKDVANTNVDDLVASLDRSDDMYSTASTNGDFYAQGLCDSLTSSSNMAAIMAAAAELADAVVLQTRKIWEINSPSKVAIGLAGYWDKGLAQGLTDNTDLVTQASTLSSQGVISAAENVMNRQAVSSVSPYSAVYAQAYQSATQATTSATQSSGSGIGDIIIPVSIGDETIETVVVNAVTRANAASGGWSV
jgi:TP901 family phage tail tape measure protein